jgi:hypothetical protein
VNESIDGSSTESSAGFGAESVTEPMTKLTNKSGTGSTAKSMSKSVIKSDHNGKDERSEQ